jgi:hypothetical protein
MTSFASGIPIVLHYFSLQCSLTDYCSGAITRMAQTVTVTITKNMIDHLHLINWIDKNGPIDLKEAIRQWIDYAFGMTQQWIDINIDMFKQCLLWWIIPNHITFHQVEDNAFRYLIFYILACVRSTCTQYSVGDAVPMIVANPSQLSDRRPHFPQNCSAEVTEQHSLKNNNPLQIFQTPNCDCFGRSAHWNPLQLRFMHINKSSSPAWTCCIVGLIESGTEKYRAWITAVSGKAYWR